jgi:hypothetical protein
MQTFVCNLRGTLSFLGLGRGWDYVDIEDDEEAEDQEDWGGAWGGVLLSTTLGKNQRNKKCA